MGEWRELAERLVEVDLAIEDFDSWATTPEDVAQLARLERLRNELHAALAGRRVSRQLRQWLDHDDLRQRTQVAFDPRD